MDLAIFCEATGLFFAFASIVYSIHIMAKIMRGAPVWIFLGITSFCMFFAMLLGVLGSAFPVNYSIQRLQQYIFLLVGALTFAFGGIKLHEMYVYK